MSSGRRNLIVAVAAGIVVAGGATAIAASQFGSSSHTAKISNWGPPVQSNGNGFNGQPGLGGNGNRLGPLPGRGGEMGGRFGRSFGTGPRGLDAAATYLGVTQSKLQTELASGKTLAQVAKDQGKTADGLVSAMVGSMRTQLDAAVSAGQFTKQQEDMIVSSLEQRFKALVNGARPSRGLGGGFGGDDGGGGPGQNGNGAFGGGTVPA